MIKGRDGEKNRGKKREKKEKTDGNSGHYFIACSRPPESRLQERRTLVPILYVAIYEICKSTTRLLC